MTCRGGYNKEEYRKMLNDVSEEYCPSGCYCILKELLVTMHPSRRMVMQLRCIDKFKYEQSERALHDVGWTGAAEAWVNDGYAAAFAIEYDDTIRFSVLYKRILARVCK